MRGLEALDAHPSGCASGAVKARTNKAGGYSEQNSGTKVGRLDSLVRRAAKRAGYIAKKDRKTGGFMIVDPDMNAVVYGWDHDLSALDVIEWCGQGLSQQEHSGGAP